MNLDEKRALEQRVISRDLKVMGKNLFVFLSLCSMLFALCLKAPLAFANGALAGSSVVNGGDSGTAGTVDSAGDTLVSGNFIGNYAASNSTAVVVSTGYAIASLAQPADQSALNAGTTIFFAYSFRNGGNTTDYFRISTSAVSGQTWNPYFVALDSVTALTQPITLAPETTYNFLLAVPIPASAANLSSMTVRLTVKDQNGSGADDSWPAGQSGASQNDTLTDDVMAMLSYVLPAKPVLTGVALSTTQISWNWNYSGNPVQGFTLYASSGGAISGALGASATNFVQSNLSQNTSYSVYVQAFNSSGTANSDAVIATTTLSLPSRPALTGVSISTTQVSWSWTYSGSPVQGFVLYGINGSAISGVLSSTATSFVQSSLTPNTSYSAYVQAFNAAGSTNSLAVSTMTLPLPSLSIIVVTSTLTVGWVMLPPMATSTASLALQWQILAGSAPFTAKVTQKGNNIGTVDQTATVSNSGLVSINLTLDDGSNLITLLLQDSSSKTVTVSTSVFKGMAMTVSNGQAKADLGVASAFYMPMASPETTPVEVTVNNGMDIAIPAGTFSGSVNVQVSVGAVPDKVLALKSGNNGGISLIPGNEGNMISIDVMSGQGKLQPSKPITLTIPYFDPTPDDNNDDLGFRIAYFDESDGKWKVTGDNVQVDAINNKVTISVNHFTLFTTLNARLAAPDFSNFIVYPNPFRPNSGDPTKGKEYALGDQESGVIFDGLTTGAKIQIYTITGVKVRELNNDTGTSRLRWDAKNESSEPVTTGIYFYLVTDPVGRKVTGKLGIVR